MAKSSCCFFLSKPKSQIGVGDKKVAKESLIQSLKVGRKRLDGGSFLIFFFSYLFFFFFKWEAKEAKNARNEKEDARWREAEQVRVIMKTARRPSAEMGEGELTLYWETAYRPQEISGQPKQKSFPFALEIPKVH